ncbi:LacI family DNA-binding transcriptional regulator [Victivallis vadensis]|uniref:LacI family DNA-binding transcriptional regulator n=1 Tax=Victivallis vadensis TaxID=172901 RepID=UPI00266CDFE2|nr:LacI family DNA-binding transcriptional regulator [Victivallis vadensis]
MSLVRKPRNLTDLARQAKVTAATVSLALRDSPQVSSEVKERIRQMAAEQGFTPRTYNRRPKPQPSKRHAHLGPILLLHYDADEGDPVRDGILPTILEKLNKHGVEYEYLNQEELRKNPVLLEIFAGALYYNDLKGITLPEDFPAAQIFGWDPMGAALDRITTNDFEVVNIAFDFFRRAGVRRAAIVWREDMVLIPDHPRIAGFLSRMDAAGIAASPLSFRREDPDFTARMKEYIESGDDRIGFFGFNALCGVKLCCALDALGLLAKYSERSILICDKSILLSGFYPRPAMIDLNLPAMADRAVEMLLYRLANPETPGLLALQSPRLLTT